MVRNLSSGTLKGEKEHRGGTYAVNIVITMYCDLLTGANGVEKTCHRFIHIWQQEWIRKLFQARMHKGMRLRRGSYPAQREQLCLEWSYPCRDKICGARIDLCAWLPSALSMRAHGGGRY